MVRWLRVVLCIALAFAMLVLGMWLSQFVVPAG